MPRAGLSDASLKLLQAAVADPAIDARYSMKTTRVPGSPCAWWTGAVSARGHGRVWLGEVGGRDAVMIVHRFGWALEHGVAALGEAPVLGHRGFLVCQRLGVGHVQLLRSRPAGPRAWRDRVVQSAAALTAVLARDASGGWVT